VGREASVHGNHELHSTRQRVDDEKAVVSSAGRVGQWTFVLQLGRARDKTAAVELRDPASA
jgi:hypothetical protein